MTEEKLEAIYVTQIIKALIIFILDRFVHSDNLKSYVNNTNEEEVLTEKGRENIHLFSAILGIHIAQSTFEFKNLTSICFLTFAITRPQSGQMLGINKGKRRRKLAVDKDK